MPFDYEGARQAGYSDAEIASFLGQQAGFDSSAAINAGYKPAEVIGFLSDKLDANKPQQTIDDQPTQGDPMGTGFAEIANAPANAPQAGGGRGFVNPPEASQPQPKPSVDRSRHVQTEVPMPDAAGNFTGQTQTIDTVYDPDEVGALKSFGLGWGESGAQTAKAANLLPAAPIVAAEAVVNTLTGKNDTSWQDWYFRNFVDPMQEAVDWYKIGPDQKQSIMAKVAQGLGAVTQELPQMIASGGTAMTEKLAASNPTIARFMEEAVSRGFDAMRPIMVKSGTEKAQQVLDAGGTPEQAAKSALTAAITTGFQGAFPMSAEGRIAKRAVTGAVVGMAQGEGSRVIQNAADPASLQQPFNPENLAVEGATGAVMAAGMGHRAPERAPAERGNQVPIYPEVRPEEVAARVMTSSTVDDAIATASREAQRTSPAADAVRADMLAIRPLRAEPETPEIPQFTVNESGTLTVLGDAKSLTKILKDAGVTSVLPAKNGVLVGKSQADLAQRVLADFNGAGDATALQPEPVRAPDAAPSLDAAQPADTGVPAQAQAVAPEGSVTTEPLKTWFGRAGNGYATEGDARMAMVSRQKADPQLMWKIEPTPEGRFRLAGYEETNVGADRNLSPVAAAADRAGATEPGVSVGVGLGVDSARAHTGLEQPAGEAIAPAGDAVSLGAERPAELGKVVTVTTPERADNPFKTFLIRNGIKTRLAADFTPGRRERLAMGRTFRESGMELDALAERAWEQGYIQSPHDVDALYGLISRVASGERVAPMYGQDGNAEMAARVERARQFEQDAAQAMDLTPEDYHGTGHVDADPAVQQRVQDILRTAHEHGLDGESLLEDAARLTENGSEHDFIQAANRIVSEAVSRAGEAGARDRGASAGEQGATLARGEEAGLTRPSAADVIAQQERAQQGARQEAQIRASEENRARADAQRGDFGLTGSDRSADSNPDQQPMFRRSAGRSGMPASDIEAHLAEPLSRLTIPGHIHETVAAARKATGVDIPDDAVGMHYNGQVHLFAENVRSPLHAEETFWHEVQHAGFIVTHGNAVTRTYETALRDISLKNANIRDAARNWMTRYGEEYHDFLISRGASPETAMNRTKLHAIDEALAELSGRNATINGAAKFIAKVQEFMRAIGLHKLANALEGKTDAEALALIYRSRESVMSQPEGRAQGEFSPAYSKDAGQAHSRTGEELSPGERFWGKIKGGEPFTAKELADAYSIGRRGTTRPLSAVAGAEHQSAQEQATAPAEWREKVAGFDGYRTVGVAAPDGTFTVGVVPETLWRGASLGDVERTAVVRYRFTPEQDGSYRLDVLDPEYTGQAFMEAAARDELHPTGNVDMKGDPYFKIDAGHTGSRAFLQEAVRRLALYKGEVPTITFPRRDTGARAGLDDPRTLGADKIERHFSRGAAFSRTAEADEEAPRERKTYAGPGAKMLESTKGALGKMLDDIFLKAAPMSAGSDTARAVAKDYANAERLARYQWTRMDEKLTHNFTEAERKAMWEAADEENVERMKQAQDPEYQRPEGVGLDRLNDKQRAAVDTLHQYGEELLQRAKDAGMFKGEGLPYWTPRMAVMIGEDGEIAKIPGEGKQATSTGQGRNITTTAQSLKQRKYLTAAETEAAASELAKQRGGEGARLVRDIRTMPMAMARLERAIAGRELVNQIKALGQKTGAPTVSSSAGPNFFTLDHPAFYSYRPRFVEEDGKTVPALDQNGEMLFDRTPIFISKDFEGPLKAIMSEKSGPLYKAFMDLKSKSMGLIMYSPLIHNAVEWGRALPIMPGKVLTFRVYFEGNKIKNDPAQMAQAIKDGVVPIGHRGQMQDITGLAEEPTLAPGRSWTAKLLGGAVGTVNEKAGESVKKGVDTAGDFWHNTLLWDRVGDLQMGLYGNIRADLIGKGMDDQTAGRLAAHFANRYAGALPNEAMSANARKIANFVLFSRSFTLGNLGVMKDMVTGFPPDVAAQIKRDAGDLALRAGRSVARRKAAAAFMLDIALLYVGNSLLQSGLDYLKRDKSLDDILHGYAERFSELAAKTKEHPLDVLGSPMESLASLTPNSRNEPGKENRILYDTDETGTNIYLRLPTGKIGEEFKDWLTSPLEMIARKQGTIMRPITQLLTNDKGFGQHVYNPDDKSWAGIAKNAGRIAWNFMSQQVPADTIQAGVDWGKGEADATDKMKVLGPLAGVTFSKGAPGGPAVGEMYHENEVHQNAVADIMPDVRRALKKGDQDKAVELMESVNMTPGEIRSVIRHQTDPQSRLSGKSLSNYRRHASEESKQRMEDYGR